MGADHGHIDSAGGFDGGFKGGFGDLVESNAVSGGGELEDLKKMPRNRFSLAVFIRGEPDGVGGFDGFFELGDNFFVSGVDFVSNSEVVFNIDFGVFANMPHAGQNMKIFTKVFFDGFGFGGRLDDN